MAPRTPSTRPVKILLLGATGSIGTSVCNCVRRFPDHFKLTGISGFTNTRLLLAQANEFMPHAVCIADTAARLQVPSTCTVYEGPQGMADCVNELDYDILLNALVGAVGFSPTVLALKRNKRVALANKESLVIGGDYINSLLKQGLGELLPVDSEHSAIFQCLMGHNVDSVESIILTASGGPFRNLPHDQLKNITPAQALNHPTWTMGKKITIDAATLMNKGFEVIEAHHLFNIGYDRLRVCVHPQSIIHSMVEFHDGAVLAQLGIPDMELPIQFALSYPERLPLQPKRLSLADIGTLTFFEPDLTKFPCLRLALEAGRIGRSLPVVLNAANEVAVDLFLNNRISFDRIPELIEAELEHHVAIDICDSATIEAVDSQTRARIASSL